MLANLHGDALLGALFCALTAASAGGEDLMRLLDFAGDGLKLALTLAQTAANAVILVDFGNLAIVPISPDGVRGASLGAHHAADALGHVELRQMVLHRDRAELACM